MARLMHHLGEAFRICLRVGGLSVSAYKGCLVIARSGQPAPHSFRFCFRRVECWWRALTITVASSHLPRPCLCENLQPWPCSVMRPMAPSAYTKRRHLARIFDKTGFPGEKDLLRYVHGVISTWTH
jgi:hypothetical protein